MVKSDKRCKKNMKVNHKNKKEGITLTPRKSRKKDTRFILWHFILELLMSHNFEPYIRWTGDRLKFVISDKSVVFTEFQKRKWEREEPTLKPDDPGVRWKDCLISIVEVKNRMRGLSSQHYIKQAKKRDDKPVIEKIQGLKRGYEFTTHEAICERLSMSYEDLIHYAQRVGSEYENVNLPRINDGKASSKKRNNKLKPTTPVNVPPTDLPHSSSLIQMKCYGAKEVQYQGLCRYEQPSESLLMDRTCSPSLPDLEASAPSSIASQEERLYSVVNQHHMWSNSHELENADMETIIHETAAVEAPMIIDKTMDESHVFECEKYQELLCSQPNPAVIYPNNFGHVINIKAINMNAQDVIITDPLYTFDIPRIDAYSHQIPIVNPPYFVNTQDNPEDSLTNYASPTHWSQLTPNYTQSVFDPSNPENPQNERFPLSYKASLEADQLPQVNPNLYELTNIDFCSSPATENEGLFDYFFRTGYISKKCYKSASSY